MNILKYLILGLTIWGIPTFYSYDINIGSKLSYLTYMLLGVFYILNTKNKPLYPFLILGFLYFVISGLVYIGDYRFYYTEFLKYFILIICGAELTRRSTNTELFIFFILGSLSIIVHAALFKSGYGRYSGFYIDPNMAGFICLIGYCIGFSIKSEYLKLIGQFILTFAGILTFSRTFILLWVVVSIISIFANKKNAFNFGIGTIVILALFSLSSILQLNTVRFSSLKNSLSDNKSNVTILQVSGEENRWETWSMFYDAILNNPFFGNGYKTLSGFYYGQLGVHNTFLMIIGEAGIITFIVFCLIYLFMLKNSLYNFKTTPHNFMLSIALIGLLSTIHNYFENFPIIIISMWLYINVTERNKIIEEEIVEPSVSLKSSNLLIK